MDAESSSTGLRDTAVSHYAKIGAEAEHFNDPDAIHEVSRELNSGEVLLWTGRPFQGWRLRNIDSVLLPFGVLWSIAALVSLIAGIEMLADSLRGQVDPINPEIGKRIGIIYAVVFVTLFPASAFHLTCGRFMLDARRRGRTWYGLTSERIIIVSGLFGRRVASIPLRELGHITFSQRDDGSGTICFEPIESLLPPRLRRLRATSRYEFERIPNVRRVVRRLMSARRKI